MLMLLHLTLSSDTVRGNRFAESMIILQQIQATFLNLEELIKDHKLRVNGETLEVSRNKFQRVTTSIKI